MWFSLYHFGGRAADATLPYAVRGYFESGGQVAYVVRVLSDLENWTA